MTKSKKEGSPRLLACKLEDGFRLEVDLSREIAHVRLPKSKDWISVGASSSAPTVEGRPRVVIWLSGSNFGADQKPYLEAQIKEALSRAGYEATVKGQPRKQTRV